MSNLYFIAEKKEKKTLLSSEQNMTTHMHVSDMENKNILLIREATLLHVVITVLQIVNRNIYFQLHTLQCSNSMVA